MPINVMILCVACSRYISVSRKLTSKLKQNRSLYSQHMFAVKSKKVEFEVALKAIDEERDHISKRDKANKDDIKAAFNELKMSFCNIVKNCF